MKNILKKIFVLCMVVSMILASTNLAFAESNKSIDAKLIKVGVPEELISSIPQDMKKDMVKDAVEFVAHKQVTLSTTDDSKDMGDDDSSVIINGTIPSTDLTLDLWQIRISNSSDGRERFRIYSEYEWLEIPFWSFDDPYGVAWDDSIFRAVPGSFYNVSYWGINGNSYSASDTVVAYSGQSGVGWNAEWEWNTGLEYINGWGKVEIESKTTGPISGSSQIYMNYAHIMGTGSVGLSFGPISVSYSGSASADTQGDLISFDY